MIKNLSLFFILFFISIKCFSQKDINSSIKEKTIQLDSLLLMIQTNHNFFISYNSKIITNKYVTLKKNIKTPLAIFKEIEDQTNLVFKKIEKKNYILKLKYSNKKICGYLFNKETNTAIYNAMVVLKPSENHVFTDSDGYFEIIPKTKNIFLSFNTLGFTEKQIPLTNFSKKKCIQIYLKEKSFELDEIIINNYLTSGFSKKIDNSILIQPTKTGLLPGVRKTDVLQSIQLLSGIQSPNDTATGLNIRGSTPDHNLILWDGIKLYRNDHFFGMISAVNSNIIDNVKLFKNSSPSFYGNHLAGVIDIQSDKNLPKKTKWGVGINSLTIDTYLKTKISKNIGVFLSARRSFSDILKTDAFTNFYSQIFQNKRVTDLGRGITVSNSILDTNNKFNFIDITTKILMKLNDKNTLSSSFFYFENTLNSNLMFEEIDFIISDYLKMKNIGLGINLKTNWNNRFSSDIKLNKISFDYNYLGKETSSDIFNFNAKKNNSINEFNFDISTKYKVNENYNIINGFNVSNSSIDYLIETKRTIELQNELNIELNNGKNFNTSLYSQHEYISDNWFLRGGIRTDHFNTLKKIYIQPSIYISRTLNDFIKLNLSTEIQYQSISQITELGTKNFGLENQVWIISNHKEVPILKSEQISLGASFNNKKWLIDMSLYYKKIDNLTSLALEFIDNTNNLKTGKSFIKGIEFFAKRSFKNFNSQLSYTYTDNDLVFPEINNGKTFKNGLNIKHDFSWIQSYEYKKLKLTLGWKYKTSRPYTPALNLLGNTPNNIDIQYGGINSAFLRDFHRMDFSAEYNFNFKKNSLLKATIGFELLNVYNQSNPLTRKHRITVNSDDANIFSLGTIDEFSISRTPLFSFRLNF